MYVYYKIFCFLLLYIIIILIYVKVLFGFGIFYVIFKIDIIFYMWNGYYLLMVRIKMEL